MVLSISHGFLVSHEDITVLIGLRLTSVAWMVFRCFHCNSFFQEEKLHFQSQ
jgi:hypothetical protein